MQGLAVKNRYRYALELYRHDGTALGQAAIDVDWEAAEQWTRLLALRRTRLAPAEVGRATSIDPIWHEKAGEPYLRGFRVRVATQSLGEVAGEFPTTYFRDRARAASQHFIEAGTLERGARVVYLMSAFPYDDRPNGDAALPFSAQDVEAPLPLPEAALADVWGEAMGCGPSRDGDVPVFVPASVLDEAAALTRRHEGQETGGVLIGHVHRDPAVPELFVRVTAQLAARHTDASATKLTFSSETWAEVRAALALRGGHEIMVGWWHSHPVRHWCTDCPPEKQAVCHLAAGFLSEHDRALHRAIFPRAYSVALVVNDVPAGPTFSLFGWRQGLLEARGFAITGAPHPPPGRELVTAETGGPCR
jgi:proteasome lid subunit RPN8/RPN11